MSNHQYEYKTISSSKELSDSTLDNYGSMRWELVSFVFLEVKYHDILAPKYIYIFKRIA